MVFYSDLKILIYRVLQTAWTHSLLYIYVSHACTVYTDTEAVEKQTPKTKHTPAVTMTHSLNMMYL